jgi:parvulin-like peptidyl-prolyl isomerase
MEIVPANFPNMKADESVEVSAAELDSKIASVLDATAVGSYTDLVEVPSGWAIFLVEGRSESKPIPLEEARSQIYNTLLQERADKYQKSFMEDLRKQNFVVINRPAVEN